MFCTHVSCDEVMRQGVSAKARAQPQAVCGTAESGAAWCVYALTAPSTGPSASPGMHEKELKQKPHSGRAMHSVGSSTALRKTFARGESAGGAV